MQHGPTISVGRLLVLLAVVFATAFLLMFFHKSASRLDSRVGTLEGMAEEKRALTLQEIEKMKEDAKAAAKAVEAAEERQRKNK